MHCRSHIHIELGDSEHIAEVEGNVLPLVRGRTYGPPEHCYPDEGGCIEDLIVRAKGEEIEFDERTRHEAETALWEAFTAATEPLED